MNTKATSLAELIPASYRLTTLDIFNWGPFQGRHRAEINSLGSAIIGPTGSGKTTLVDAFMTLICAQPRYNLASTGGHESDRDLMSYVRGVTGAGNNSGSGDHITRQGKTITAIGADFSDGERRFYIAALLWLDGSSSALSDLKRAWVLLESPDSDISSDEASSGINPDAHAEVSYGIDELLEIQQRGGMRALKQLGRETVGVKVFESKKSYLAQLRRFFEVGENAFTLLNRAAGLKQLNSIDELFRELVLDDHSAFTRAAEVATEFDDLAGIHGELEIARKQQLSLQPIDREYQAYQSYCQQQEQLQQLRQILPIWYASHADQLWRQQEQNLTGELQRCAEQSAALNHQVNAQEEQVNELRDLYMQSGGASIEQLEQQLRLHRDTLKNRQRHANNYLSIARALNLDNTLSPAALADNKQCAADLTKQHRQELEAQQLAAYEKGAVKLNHKETVQQLEQDLENTVGNRSNIPGNFLMFQAGLSKALDIEIEQLPFVAELVEVKPEQNQWRGAIERAIGSHRLRLMVPEVLMKPALAWVNNRHNQLHVRLLEVTQKSTQSRFLDNGFTRKLTFKEHPHREALKHLLAGIDRHCVDSPEALRTTPHGLTQQGLMSGKAGYFDKQDQRRLNQDWMTGFDNRDRLAQLQNQLQQAQTALQESERQDKLAQQACAELAQGIVLLETLQKQHFDDIDVPGATEKITTLEQTLRAINDPASDTAQAKQRWQQAGQRLTALRNQEKQLFSQSESLQQEQQNAHTQQQRAVQLIGDGLTDQQQTLADQHFEIPTLNGLTEQQQNRNKKLQQELDSCSTNLSDSSIELTRLMSNAQKMDTGALAEVGTELKDTQEYIDRLRVLTEEALPEKLQRFLDYLNQSSDQGVTQLLTLIENEVDKIQYRIEDLNHTMRQVDFQPGRYLQLNPQPVVHESLRTLQQAQRHLRYAATQDDDGESHYRALQTVIELLRDASERKRIRGSQALLDPRYRLEFSVSIIERSTANIIETRTGSQGGSGGEKEIIASYILTASLSYALCPEGSPIPLFGTIILDEAFSKSSQAVAGRIISALREFGLHPLFITPNKEIKLLRSHTRSAVLIHNRAGVQATITNLSWEQLEQQATKQRIKADEITY